MTGIAECAQRAGHSIAQVEEASRQQAQGIDQINAAMTQIDRTTQSGAANAEEAASASEELSAQAGELDEMVNALISVVRGGRRNDNGWKGEEPVHSSSGRSEGKEWQSFHSAALPRKQERLLLEKCGSDRR